MLNEKFQRSRMEYAWESQIDRLPQLTPTEEENYFRIAFQGQFFPPSILLPSLYRQSKIWPNIEITGMPKLQKTKILNEVSPLLTLLGVPHHRIGEEDVSHQWQNTLAQNGFLFTNSLKHLLSLEFNGLKKGPVLIERALYNYLAFSEVEYRMEERSLHDLHMMQHFIETEFGGLIDVLIIVNSSPETSIRNGSNLEVTRLRPLSEVYDQLPNTIRQLKQKYAYNSPLLICSLNVDNSQELQTGQMFRIFGSIFRILSR